LSEKWPNSVKVVDDIEFSFAENAGDLAVPGTKRKLLHIDLTKMNDEQREAFKTDYLAAMARQTVSFPIGEGGGHLYSRLGTDSFDAIHRMMKNSYRTPGSPRLEPVMSLTPSEELKLRFYIDQAAKDKNTVVGPFSMGGVADGRTQGTLRENRSKDLSQGHNCTSWICTAPISDDKKPLMTIAGATPSMEVHTNPGWWNSWLVGQAPKDKVPYVVFWDTKGNSTFQPGQKFKSWQFDRH
jgi:hypothetical protein